MKKRIIAALLAIGLLFVLSACGGETEGESTAPVSYGSLEALTEAAGFPVTALPLEDGTPEAYLLLNETVAVTMYSYQDTRVELSMSVTEGDLEGLSGITNGKAAGGVQTNDSSFSALEVYNREDTYYCEFSYRAAEGLRYYALVRDGTDFNGYAEVLQVLITTLQAEKNQ